MKNLFLAWSEFKKGGKLKKPDVGIFAADLEENVFALYEELRAGVYRHGGYEQFVICDPKRRVIHKANVRDRLLHHAVFRVLYPIFNKDFIFDSFSSRGGKGVHKAKDRFERFALSVSRNNTRTVHILKCDIQKFYDNVDHNTLIRLLGEKIEDKNVMSLIRNIVVSFEKTEDKGIPIGNLTSQLFSNVYLDSFDQFVKRELRIKYYVRYADDFIICSDNRDRFKTLIPVLQSFLKEKLSLTLHPQKLIERKWNQGVDFLGFVSYPRYSVLRTKTRKRIIKRIAAGIVDEGAGERFRQMVQSYKGIFSHCKGFHMKRKIKKIAGKFYESKP